MSRINLPTWRATSFLKPLPTCIPTSLKRLKFLFLLEFLPSSNGESLASLKFVGINHRRPCLRVLLCLGAQRLGRRLYLDFGLKIVMALDFNLGDLCHAFRKREGRAKSGGDADLFRDHVSLCGARPSLSACVRQRAVGPPAELLHFTPTCTILLCSSHSLLLAALRC